MFMPLVIGAEHYRYRVRLEGVHYRFDVHYNLRMDRYFVTIKDDGDNVLVGPKCVVVMEDFYGRHSSIDGMPPGKFHVRAAQGGDPGLGELGTRVSFEYEEAA